MPTPIQLKPERVEEYKALHAAVWSTVLATLTRHHITDYSIHHYPPLQLLVATFKYTGDDYDKDMAAIAADQETQRWWKLTDGMQESFNEGATGSGGDVPWWAVSGRYEGWSSAEWHRLLGSRGSVPLRGWLFCLTISMLALSIILLRGPPRHIELTMFNLHPIHSPHIIRLYDRIKSCLLVHFLRNTLCVDLQIEKPTQDQQRSQFRRYLILLFALRAVDACRKNDLGMCINARKDEDVQYAQPPAHEQRSIASWALRRISEAVCMTSELALKPSYTQLTVIEALHRGTTLACCLIKYKPAPNTVTP